MGCGGCGAGGCNGSGKCSSGSCNRMDVFNWLADIPEANPADTCRIVEISFNNGSRKDFFINTTPHFYIKGDMVTVEGMSGYDVGMVNLSGELVRLQLKKRHIDEKKAEFKKILRRASETDLAKMKESKQREKEMLIRSRAIARQLNLNMKMSLVELQADSRKATFYYIADDRVDFRELIKRYASEFKVKVEMRQIGARQEAGKVGGIGSSGRELCSSTWINNFKSVNTAAARYQNLSINQSKLSGQCGRLKCCLNYELDTYLDALQHFPNDADVLELTKGKAFLVKKDIFKNLMWYSMADSNKQYPLSIDTVKRIQAQNKEGIKPEELETADPSSGKLKEIEPEYADLVGQISLRTLERTTRKRRDREKSRQQAKQSTTHKQGKSAQKPQNGKQGYEARSTNKNQPSQKNQPRPQRQPGSKNAPKPNRPPQQRGAHPNKTNNGQNNPGGKG